MRKFTFFAVIVLALSFASVGFAKVLPFDVSTAVDESGKSIAAFQGYDSVFKPIILDCKNTKIKKKKKPKKKEVIIGFIGSPIQPQAAGTLTVDEFGKSTVIFQNSDSVFKPIILDCKKKTKKKKKKVV